MGRNKYSEEAKNTVMAAFVKAAMEIIDAEGIEAASIRRIASKAGYSSATLYLYFEGLDELVTMSLVSYLKDYIDELVDSTQESDSVEESYRKSWKLFCEHAFANPEAFTNLYFGSQTYKLESIASKYYELFPYELGKASGTMLSMLKQGNLFERNRVIISSLAEKIGLSEHELDIANDLTVSYFHHFLDIASATNPDEKKRDELTNQFLEGAFFILRN